MDGSLLRDAFDHHSWATLKLIDTCLELSPEQLDATAPGTYGSIIDTIRHLVGADTWYLTAFQREAADIDEEAMGLPELRDEADRNAGRWRAVLERELDPADVVRRVGSSGSESFAPVGIRLAQVVHHGTDHRSHVCTILTTLGIEPPDIDTWAFAESQGRVRIVPPPAAAAS